MSKIVNPAKMTRFDRRYLADRGIDPDEYAEKYRLVDGQLVARDEGPSDAELNETDEDVVSEGGLPEPPDEITEDMAGDQATTDDEDEDAEDDGYSTWGNEDLREELRRRELTVNGKKRELIARLEADDAERESSDDEDDS